MASTADQAGASTAVAAQRQGHNYAPPLTRRPPRRASTLEYGAPSASSSDAESGTSSGRRGLQKKRRKFLWDNITRIGRDKVLKGKNPDPSQPPSQPLSPDDMARAEGGCAVDEERADRAPSQHISNGFWRRICGLAAERAGVEEDHGDPERASRRDGFVDEALPERSCLRNLGDFLGMKLKATVAESPDCSSSYETSNSSSTSNPEVWLPEFRIFHYDIKDWGIKGDPGPAVFDSSRFEKNELRSRFPAVRRRLRRAFEDAYNLETPDKVKLMYEDCLLHIETESLISPQLRLIKDDQDAMVGFIRDAFSDSPWFGRHGQELLERVNNFGSDDQLGPSSKKAQFFRIRPDEKREMDQSAFCINQWLAPLEEDDNIGSASKAHKPSRLHQLVVYWQYKWSIVQEEEGNKELSRKKSVVNAKDQPGPATDTRPIPQAGEDVFLNRKPKRDIVGAGNEQLFNSNVIVVFERSRVRHRDRRHTKSIILDNVIDPTPNGTFAFKPNEAVNGNHSKERVAGLHIIQLLKSVIEALCDSLVDNLDNTIDYYSFLRASLADRVERNPEDDTLTPKLWLYYRRFKDVGKIINLLALLVDDVRSAFRRHLNEQSFSESFLADLPSTFKSLTIDVEEELQKPTADMIDLVYKSVSIKDARLSLELNSSLWRLSWVTFIFLPLTFLSGFFGMNVDTFENNPSIKWLVKAKSI